MGLYAFIVLGGKLYLIPEDQDLTAILLVALLAHFLNLNARMASKFYDHFFTTFHLR